MRTSTADYIDVAPAASTWPTSREIAAVSRSPKRFRDWHDRALEVEGYARMHGGKVPLWVWGLSDARYSELSATLRELDGLRWVRRMTAT